MEFIDLKSQYFYLQDEINRNMQDVIAGADFILGNKVMEFEQKLAKYIGVKHVVSCSNGTAALQLIYMANHIGSGDAVFCPDMTFIASIEPACMLGASPVFCEIDADTYNISPHSLERQIQNVLNEEKLTPKAVVVVDFLGNPAEYTKLKQIAEKYDLLLIEDAAQAMGASYDGVKCGAIGDVAATSFFPSKPLGCYGDGGAVFTDDDDIAELLRSLRVHGKGETKYDNVRIGLNSRLDSLQAAILLPKLRVLNEEVKKRQKIAKNYSDFLKDKIKVPFVASNSVSSFAQFVLMAESEEQRIQLQRALELENIPTIRYYPNPLHRLPVFNRINTYGERYENADRYAACSFGIPFSPYISAKDVEKVSKCILNALS